MSIKIEDILQAAVTEVQSFLACDRVLVAKINQNNTVSPISESILPDLSPMLGYEIADPLLMGEYLTQYRLGKELTINNLATASISLDIKQLLKQFQIQAKLVVPILSQHQLKGLLIAHQCHRDRQWQESKIQLLKQLADQIGVALSQAQLLNNLEGLVFQRTDELTTTNQLLKTEIAERKQTEVALRENQQRLAGILDNADEGIISINEQQQIQLFNQGAERIFGYQAYEVIGERLDILLPKVFRHSHREHINEFGQSREHNRRMAERRGSVFGRRKNGAEFSAEASIAKLQTKDGTIFTVMLKDITERQQTEDNLLASKTMLATAEKIAKIGSWEYNHLTQQRTWSDELFQILGFDRERAIPSCLEIIARVHPEDYLLVKNTLTKGHTEGEPWKFSYRLLLPDGTLKYVESRGEPTLDSQGNVVKVLETIMDISDRIQAEKSFQRSEEHLRLITDALPILIAYIDNQHRYRYVETALAGKVVSFENQPVIDTPTATLSLKPWDSPV